MNIFLRVVSKIKTLKQLEIHRALCTMSQTVPRVKNFFPRQPINMVFPVCLESYQMRT